MDNNKMNYDEEKSICDDDNFRQRLRAIERKNAEIEEQLHEFTEQFEIFINEHGFPTAQEIYEKQEECMNISHELWVKMITFYADISTNQYKLAFIVDIMQAQALSWPSRPSERQATYALGLLAEYQASLVASSEPCQANQAQQVNVMETSSQKGNSKSEGWSWRVKDWGFFKKG